MTSKQELAEIKERLTRVEIIVNARTRAQLSNGNKVREEILQQASIRNKKKAALLK